MARSAWLALLAVISISLLTMKDATADIDQISKIQSAMDKWVATRASAEKITGVAAYISFGDPGPAIEAFAGKVGIAPQDPPVGRDTLFQMGSTSKSFADAIILKLEAANRLSLSDSLGKWLPQYPAWKNVTIRRLLNMTSGIPNYSETQTISEMWSKQPTRDLTAEELIKIVYPTEAKPPPLKAGYEYSNTNYVLAGMIAAKITGHSYRDLVQTMIIEPYGLHSTFYENGIYPPAILNRLAHGYFNNPVCTDFQPNCKVSWNLPMVGREVSRLSTSWAQAAGGAVAGSRDVDHWMRAVFEGLVVPPQQQAEWMSLISTKSGDPIADVSPDDPRGFGLGVSKAILGPLGAQWFYQGETLGFRTLYVWFKKKNLMITLQTNSQPDAQVDTLKDLLTTVYSIVE
jgi:D-alanyl-D-alanine carboxypeptidase